MLSNLSIDPRAYVPSELVDLGDAYEFDLPKPGVALCLSGGGYRAMLFHLGVLWRLNKLSS
jgi:hypothetical protein